MLIDSHLSAMTSTIGTSFASSEQSISLNCKSESLPENSKDFYGKAQSSSSGGIGSSIMSGIKGIFGGFTQKSARASAPRTEARVMPSY